MNSLFRRFFRNVIFLPITQTKSRCCWHHFLQSAKGGANSFLRNVKSYPALRGCQNSDCHGKLMPGVSLRSPQQVSALRQWCEPSTLKYGHFALAGVAQWIGCQPMNQRVMGQGTCLGCGPGPQFGVYKRQPHIAVSLSLSLSLSFSLSPSLPLSLEIHK